MSTSSCARCRGPLDPATASFGEEGGLICQRCHAGVIAGDAAQLRAAVEDARRGPSLGLDGPALSFTSQTRTETRHEDGSVTAAESAAWDGWALRFFRKFFGKG